jgi:hypothetical protein
MDSNEPNPATLKVVEPNPATLKVVDWSDYYNTAELILEDTETEDLINGEAGEHNMGDYPGFGKIRDRVPYQLEFKAIESVHRRKGIRPTGKISKTPRRKNLPVDLLGGGGQSRILVAKVSRILGTTVSRILWSNLRKTLQNTQPQMTLF